MTQIHVLKSWPMFFHPIVDGVRTHELRHNDRGFASGDVLELHEYDVTTKTFTGATATALVTTMADVSQLGPDFCIMNIRLLSHSAQHPMSDPTEYEQAQELRWRQERGEIPPLY